MSLYGKGFWIWQIPRCENGIPSAIAARAVEAGLSHVLIKIADGSKWVYNYDYDTNVDLVPPVVYALREAGIQVWGWHYIWGEYPQGEAQLAIERTKSLGLDGYVIDAEAEFKQSGKIIAARRFVQDLRAGLPNLPIALSSYRFPKSHPRFPFAEFLKICDYSMPQVYFEQATNVEEQLERSVEQYMAIDPSCPVIPTAPTYFTSRWRPSADEISRFFQKAKDMDLTAVNAWSWDYTNRPNAGDLWQAVADYEWTAPVPVPDICELLIGRMNQHNPLYVADLYHDNAAHVTGARTVIGREPISEWYRVLFNQLLPYGQFELTGRSGRRASRTFTWTASSDNGTVLNGNDTLGLINGKIQYHYTYFTIT
jgi:hypothetical protein